MICRIMSVVCWLVVLSGCQASTNPYFVERKAQQYEKEELDETEKIRMSYLARFMLGKGDRDAWAEKAHADVIKRRSDYLVAADMASTADIAADLLTGEVNSAYGAAIGSTVFVAGVVAGMLMDKGDLDQISQAFLPEVWKGKKLETQSDATSALYELMNERVHEAAGKSGMEIECIYGCSTGSRIYHLVPNGKANEKRYVYIPEGGIYIVTNWQKMLLVDKDSVRDSILGFTPKWGTDYGHTLETLIGSRPMLNDSGEIKYRINRHGVLKVVLFDELAVTSIGRDLYSEIFSKKLPAYYFDNDLHPNLGFYHGDIYTWVLENPRVFIKEKIVNVNYVAKVY